MASQRIRFVWIWLSLILSSCVQLLHAGEETGPKKSTTDVSYDNALGKWEIEPIYAGEIDYFLGASMRTAQTEKSLQALRSRGVELAIDRRRVLAALRQRDQRTEASDASFVDTLVRERTARLQVESRKLDAWLVEHELHLDSYRHILLWQHRWASYLDQVITDESRQKFFDRHRTEFDGTKLRVAHIFWPIAAREKTTSDGHQESNLENRAEQARQPQHLEQTKLTEADHLRTRILASEISFADAARQFSQSPTAQQGGEIGWIGRREPMADDFSRAAFELKIGEISPPVRSRLGVHLITCLEQKLGQRTWQQVKNELTGEMQRRAFFHLKNSQQLPSTYR